MVYTNLKRDILEENKYLLYDIFDKMRPIPSIDSTQSRQKRSADGYKSDNLSHRQERIIHLGLWFIEMLLKI